MGWGDIFSAGAEALGVDTDDIGGLFDKAKSVVGGDGDAGDLFKSAASAVGLDEGDAGGFFDTAKRFAGGDDDASNLFKTAARAVGADEDDIGGFFSKASELVDGDAGQAFGTFSKYLSDGAASDFLPSAVKTAMADAGDLPLVKEAASGDWMELARSMPGLGGSLGSFGVATAGADGHVDSAGIQSVDSGSSFSFSNMLADGGPRFLQQVAATADADTPWTALPGIAQRAGVELPGWAADAGSGAPLAQSGRVLDDGGYLQTEVEGVDDPWVAARTGAVADSDGDDITGEAMQGANDSDPALGEATNEAQAYMAAHDEFASYTPDETAVEQQPPPEPVEVMDAPEPPPAPEPIAAADQVESDLGDLGDDAFG